MLPWITGLTVFLGLSIMSNASATDSQSNVPQYFRSWASYEIPMRPTGPVKYIETEALSSYYVGAHDASGRLKRFIKLWRRTEPAGHADIGAVSPVSGPVYFLAIHIKEDEYRRGDRIEYAKTENAPVYFKGTLIQGGHDLVLELVHVIAFFDDQYEYWPNGKLRARVLRKQDGETQRTTFDESGQISK